MAPSNGTNGTNGASSSTKTTPPSRDLASHSFSETAQTLSTPSTKPNAWSTPGNPGPSAFDLRSDVVTTPTTSMLQSIAATTLLDDVFLEDPTTAHLSSLITRLTDKPAALLVLSGTMGNQLALRTHLPAPPAAVIADSRCHIMTWEAGGGAWLSGAFFQPIAPGNGHHLTLEDVKAHAETGDDVDVHKCPTRLICLENTLNGSILPLSECRAISTWARAQKPPIPLHLDGARLWEAVAAGAGSLEDYCACFDSVSLCFSKGLGAPIGSVLVGSEAFVKRARHVRKAFGGGLRQAGVVSAPAIVSVNETFLGGLLRGSHERAREMADVWRGWGGRLEYEVESNMVWCDLAHAGVSKEEWVVKAQEEGLRVMGGRLVVHYQIGGEAVKRFATLAQRVLQGQRRFNGGMGGGDVDVDDNGEGKEAKRMKLDVE